MGLSSDDAEWNQGGKRPQEEAPLRCPRCESDNTKFCYYNNYSLSQPRHYCRVCRRHWTHGGALRDVPFGGNRRNRRTKATDSSSSSWTTTTTPAEINQPRWGCDYYGCVDSLQPPPLGREFPVLVEGSAGFGGEIAGVVEPMMYVGYYWNGFAGGGTVEDRQPRGGE